MLATYKIEVLYINQVIMLSSYILT
jgi:hypothetical protein